MALLESLPLIGELVPTKEKKVGRIRIFCCLYGFLVLLGSSTLHGILRSLLLGIGMTLLARLGLTSATFTDSPEDVGFFFGGFVGFFSMRSVLVAFHFGLFV